MSELGVHDDCILKEPKNDALSRIVDSQQPILLQTG